MTDDGKVGTSPDPTWRISVADLNRLGLGIMLSASLSNPSHASIVPLDPSGVSGTQYQSLIAETQTYWSAYQSPG
jgi:hypothetical protein